MNENSFYFTKFASHWLICRSKAKSDIITPRFFFFIPFGMHTLCDSVSDIFSMLQLSKELYLSVYNENSWFITAIQTFSLPPSFSFSLIHSYHYSRSYYYCVRIMVFSSGGKRREFICSSSVSYYTTSRIFFSFLGEVNSNHVIIKTHDFTFIPQKNFSSCYSSLMAQR